MTTLRVYKGVPWSYGTPHIKYTTNKLSYLSNFFKFAIGGCNVGEFTKIVVPKTLLEIQDCNYCHFQVAEEDYFCFIISCRYVNENATELTLQPDWMFMYMDSITWKKCMIERHHYNLDSTNMIRTGEGFNPPLDVYNTYYPFSMGGVAQNTLTAVCFTNLNPTTGLVDTTTPPLTDLRGLVNSYRGYEVTDVRAFSEFLNGLDNPEPDPETTNTMYLPEHILGIVYVPNMFISRVPQGITGHGLAEIWMTPKTGTFTIPDYTPYFQGYTPVNRKLSYSPEFTYIEISDGFANKVKLDRSKMNSLQFRWTCTPSPDFTVHITPVRYNNEDYPEEYSIDITNFPQATWNSDTYKIFMLNNKNQMQTATEYSGLKYGASVVQGSLKSLYNPVEGLSDIGSSALNTMETLDQIHAKIKDAQHSPTQTKGEINSLTRMLARDSLDNKYTFLFFNYCACNYNDTEAIDDFFTHYGYKFNREEVPSPTHRNTYTYYKLLETNYLCDCNNEARSYIDSLLLNGITFWYGNEVYSY